MTNPTETGGSHPQGRWKPPSRAKRLLAYLNGVREFRLSLTTHYDDYDLLCAYDLGREHANRVTGRRWDPSA